MSLYEQTLDVISKNKEVKESGSLLAIPFWRMPNLSKVLPGLRKGMYSLISAGTKESKSQLASFMFVHQPIEYLFAHPECGLDLRVKMFSLEISKEDVMAQVMSYRLFSEYGIIISPLHLMSIFKEYTIEDRILDIIKSDEFRAYIDFFETKVEIIDNIKTPTGIMINCEKYARANGKVVYEETTWDDGSVHKIIKEYIPNNPNEIVEVIVDHATLLAEKGKTLYECIKVLSSEHFLKLKNTYKYSPLLVQQQNSESSTQQFTNRGDSILEKVKPSREGLSSNKDSAMDVNLMIGIFSPYKYKEEIYEGWDLTRIRDYHRELSIILNRNGRSNITQQLFFNGASSFFKELPPSPSPETRQNIYKAIDGYRNEELKYTN